MTVPIWASRFGIRIFFTTSEISSRTAINYPHFVLQMFAMAGDDDGDAHTLGLLVELRALCQKIVDHNNGYAIEAHRLLQQLSNPNLHGLGDELHFSVVQLGPATTAKGCAWCLRT
jgi:hypothetical protein